MSLSKIVVTKAKRIAAGTANRKASFSSIPVFTQPKSTPAVPIIVTKGTIFFSFLLFSIVVSAVAAVIVSSKVYSVNFAVARQQP